MKAKLRAAWAVLRPWGAAIVGAVLVLLGAGWLWRRDELGAARDEASIERSRRKMDGLRARREEVTERIADTDADIKVLDAEIEASERRLVELHEGGAEAVADEDLEEEFDALGY